MTDKSADRLEDESKVGSAVSTDARRALQVLEAVSENARITQRTLASKLGIAVGLANLCVKRLARKGFIKCVNVQSNRMLYLITPKGLAEKTRLTYEFVQYSLHLYRRVRLQLASMLRPLVEGGPRRIAIYGRDEAAELAYLSLKEFGLELGEDVEIRVWDSTSELRYLVLPERPAGTEGMSEEELAELVSRDAMIGVAKVEAPATATEPA